MPNVVWLQLCRLGNAKYITLQCVRFLCTHIVFIHNSLIVIARRENPPEKTLFIMVCDMQHDFPVRDTVLMSLSKNVEIYFIATVKMSFVKMTRDKW